MVNTENKNKDKKKKKKRAKNELNLEQSVNWLNIE